MTPAERLVNHIREFVHGFEQEATPEAHEMSMQYSDLCHSLNNRLAKCVDFLRKGRRTEAVQAALTQPSVFELTETLEFEEAKNWLNLCLDLEMIPAPEINFDAIERLQEECTKEQLLEPLLREFRRLVHSGSRDERIHMLRRIRSHDQDNPVWRENLEPLEQEQLVELKALAAERMAAGDFDAVLDIYTDMTAKHRVVEAPAEAITAIESWLHKQREKTAFEEGKRLSEAIYDALEQRNFQGLQVLLQAWDRLARYPDFKPSAAMADAVGKANAWYQTEERARKRKSEFDADLRKLQGLLKNPRPDQRQLAAQWDALQTYTEPLPDGLEATVDDTLRRLREAVSAKRRRRALVASLVFVVIVGGGAVGAFYGYRYRKTENAKAVLSALWTAGRYQDLSQRLTQLKETPWLYESSQAALFVNKTNQKLAAEAARLGAFKKVMTALDQVKSQKYSQDDEIITAILNEGLSYALTDAEKGQLNNWRKNWKAWQASNQAQVDAKGAAKITRLERDLKRLKEDTGAPLDQKLRNLKALTERADQVTSAINQTSASVKEQLRRLNIEIRKYAAALDREQVAQEAAKRQYASALAGIPRTAGNMDAWRQELQRFIQSFPTAAETPALKMALAQYSAAEDAVSLGGFQVTQMPETAAEKKAIEEVAQGLPAGRESVWRADLLTLAAQYTGDTGMREALNRLRLVDFYDFRQVKIRPKGEKEDAAWKTLYIPKYFHSKDVDGKEGVKQYWGLFYGLKPDATERLAKPFDWTTDEYDMVWPEEKPDQLTPEGKYARAILDKIPKEKVFYFLLKTIDDLKADPDIHTIPKAVMLKILGEALQKGLPMAGIGFEVYGQAFDGVNLDVPWENYTNEDVMAVEQDVARRIAALPETKKPLTILTFNQQLLKMALNRRVQCVGLVWRDEQTGRLRPFLAQKGLYSLWTVLPAGQGMGIRFKEIATSDTPDDFSLLGGDNSPVIPGQLLFAPADHKTCKTLLTDLPPPPSRDKIRWPSSWPVNQRILP